MSNAYLDWMRDGGPCGDCVHNVFIDGEAVCDLTVESHTEERCAAFREEPISPVLLYGNGINDHFNRR